MMNFLNTFGKIKSSIGEFLNKPTTNKALQPQGVVYARYIARLVILFMVLFIFMWWPVDSFTPEGFDTWSVRMKNLPDQVWYVVLGVIMSWGTTEVMAARALSNNNDQSYQPMDDYSADPYEPDLGRFANLSDGADMLADMTEPNPIIEEWIDNETTDS